MKKIIISLCLLASFTSTDILAAKATTQAGKKPSITLYTANWSMYSDGEFPAYQYDGAYDSKNGSYNNRPIVHNQAMVDQFNKADVIAWSFMQVWNNKDPAQAKYNIPDDYNGIMHFSDLYGGLPPSSNTDAVKKMKETCNILGAAACSAIQMNGMTQQKQLFNYAIDPSTGQLNSFNAFMDPAKYRYATRIIALGGANTSDNNSIGYHTFQAIFANPKKFTANLAKWIQAYPALKGVDYDFEPPIDQSGGQLPASAQTYKDYAALLKVVQATRTTLGPKAHISITITPNMDYLQYINDAHKDSDGNGDWFKQMAKSASLINVMTYDFHGPWGKDGEPKTALHTYLAQPDVADKDKFPINYGGKEVVNQILSYGVPAHQLQMGIANYGRAYAGVPNAQATDGVDLPGFDQPWANAATFPKKLSNQTGLLPYRSVGELLAQGYKNYDVHQALRDHNSDIVGSYLYHPTTNSGTFVAYESPAEVQAVCKFVKDKKLAGVILWDAASDLPVSNQNSLLMTFAKCSS